eukprot:5190743-Pleurochrysis_carterae.AAC.3
MESSCGSGAAPHGAASCGASSPHSAAAQPTLATAPSPWPSSALSGTASRLIAFDAAASDHSHAERRRMS